MYRSVAAGGRGFRLPGRDEHRDQSRGARSLFHRFVGWIAFRSASSRLVVMQLREILLNHLRQAKNGKWLHRSSLREERSAGEGFAGTEPPLHYRAHHGDWRSAALPGRFLVSLSCELTRLFPMFAIEIALDGPDDFVSWKRLHVSPPH
jgi:hypothetical protein